MHDPMVSHVLHISQPWRIVVGMTQPTATETTDTRSDSGTIHWSVLVLMIAVAAMAMFASLYMSFHGLRDLVERSENVIGSGAAIGPFGIDGLQLASLFAIIITVGARTRVRVYLWLVFFSSIGVSVAMNASDAALRHAGAVGMVLSGFWPALLAAATHVVVVAVRWWLESRRNATAALTPAIAVVRREPGGDEDGEPSESKEPTEAQLKAWARKRYLSVRSSRKVAEAMTANGTPVSEKQVERWTKSLRTAPAVTDAPSPEPSPVTA